MNPKTIHDSITKELRAQTRQLRPVDETLCPDIKRMIDEYEFLSKTYLESITYYQQSTDTSLDTLVHDGKLEPETAELFAAYFGKPGKPEDIHLYQHQIKAIHDARDGKSLVICTGTGSGKTESFLIPVIDSIIRERKGEREKNKPHQSGVRAMILYPMNALVNDQVRRIRSILKCVDDIPSEINVDRDAMRITYGIYTGELDDDDRTKAKPAETAAIKKINDGIDETTPYRYLSGEQCPPNEYTTRERWLKDGSADILITNYSMLELLMIRPDRRYIIEGKGALTWKFIVLDEAHTYDGALGTDISWLIRRLAVRTGSENLQYIATSATLVDPSEEAEPEKAIVEKFASKLFPVEEDKFSVLLGEAHRDNWETPKILGEKSYTALANHCVPHIVEQIHSRLDEIRSMYSLEGTAIYNALIDDVKDNATLVDISRWHLELDKWLKPWLEMKADSRTTTFGEVVAYAGLIQQVDPDYIIGFDIADDLKQAYLHFINKKSDISDIISEVLGNDSLSKIKLIKKEITNSLYAETLSMRVETFIVFANIMQMLCDGYVFTGTILNPVATWKLKWGIDTLNKLQNYKNAIFSLRQFNQETLSTLVKTEWELIIGKKGEKGYDSLITDFLLEQGHIIEISKSLGSRTDHQKREQAYVVDTYFKGNDDEFFSFVELLSLSKHPNVPGKPLMDIRFHQIASGISNVSVWFEKNAGNKVQAHFIPDTVGYHDNEGHLLYSFSICYDCGYPYISVYMRTNDKDTRKSYDEDTRKSYDEDTRKSYDEDTRKSYFLSRYPEHDEDNIYVFTWIKHKNVATSKSKTRYWLDHAAGVLEESKEDRSNNPKYIELYAPEKNGGTQKFISKCPICGGKRDKDNGIEEGIIAPYKSGDDRARITILSCLVKNADASICSNMGLAQGRKVLAFSDSRPSAAKLAVDFDRYIEERLVEQCVVNALKTQKSGDELVSYYADIKDFQNKTLKLLIDAKKNKNNNEEAIKKLRQIPGTEQVIKDLQKCGGETESPEVLKNSLAAIVPSLKDYLDSAGGKKIYERKYFDENKKEEFSFLEIASLSLTALGALKDKRKHSLLSCGRFRPYSYAYSQKSKVWDDYRSRFSENPSEADICFQKVYEYLYKRAYLYAESYDEKEGSNYGLETPERILNGYGINYPSYITYNDSKDNNINFRSLVSRIVENAEEKKIPEALFKCMKNADIICSDKNNQKYSLNLNDIRFEYLKDELLDDTDKRKYYRIEEHTAQLSSYQGRIYQNAFVRGQINILSCSTTFEMGVDLGNLNCVYLNNMPPSVSNYCQRAGRAGRRPGSSSYVLTYIGSASHDQHYKEEPYKLFFGKVAMPLIYRDNPSFRAKHMRAEALADFFLWLSEHNYKWKLCGDLIYKKQKDKEAARGSIVRLKEWSREHEKVVQCTCEKIAGCELSYPVAQDLKFQMYKEDTVPDYFKSEDHCMELSGPRSSCRRDDFWSSPVDQRFKREYDEIKNEYKAKVQFENLQSTSYLAEYQVIPHYGFPADVIQLITNYDQHSYGVMKKNKDTGVRLTRDMRIGLFEYAPGQKVVADKYVYTSEKALTYSRKQGKDDTYVIGAINKSLYKCNDCDEYYLAENETEANICPFCRREGVFRKLKALRPDAFKAKKGRKRAKAFMPVIRTNKVCLYSGGFDEKSELIPTNNLKINKSHQRTLIYINDRKPENSNDEYDVLYHAVNTDIVLWSAVSKENCPFADNADRLNHAWESALSAITFAIADVLAINRRDVGGIITHINQEPYMAIFDNSLSGSGSVMRLMPSMNKKENVEKLSYDILSRAITICKSCNCSKHVDIHKKPAKHYKVIYAAYSNEGNNLRDYKACYNCIMSYDNQKLHDTLDAYDALRLLEWLMGEDKGEGVEVGSEMMKRLSYEDRLDLLEGNVRKGMRYIVRDDELEEIVEMEYQYTMGEAVYFLWDGMPREISIDNIIDKK